MTDLAAYLIGAIGFAAWLDMALRRRRSVRRGEHAHQRAVDEWMKAEAELAKHLKAEDEAKVLAGALTIAQVTIERLRVDHLYDVDLIADLRRQLAIEIKDHDRLRATYRDVAAKLEAERAAHVLTQELADNPGRALARKGVEKRRHDVANDPVVRERARAAA